MPALFPWWANSVARASLLAALVTVLAASIAAMAWARSSSATGERAVVEQPVAFDHRVHAHALRIDCRFCHATAEIAANAGMPPTTACIGCHVKGLQDGPAFAPVRFSLSSRRPIAWRRVDALPDFVYFDHSIHVNKGVGCETCHGRVDRMGRVTQVTPMSMAWCVDCHRDPGPSLRPRSEIATMGWIAPTGAAGRDSAAALVRRYRVRPLTNCSTCHR